MSTFISYLKIQQIAGIEGNDLNLLRENMAENILYGMIIIAMVLFGFFLFVGQLQLFQFFQLAISALMLYSTILMTVYSNRSANASRLQAEASKLQAEAVRESLRASVAPRLKFRIRPANDYWNGPFGIQPRGWKHGVGIYIENIGLGHALNIKMSYKAVGEIEEQRCKAKFGRIRVGEIYTLPSKQYPQLDIKTTHSKIIIESLEYDDMRTPPNHYKFDEPETLEINPVFFEEPDKGKAKFGPKYA